MQKNHLIRLILLICLLIFVEAGFAKPLSISNSMNSPQYESFQFEDTISINRALLQVKKKKFSEASEAKQELKKISQAANSLGYIKGVGEASYQTGVIEYRQNRYHPALRNFDSANKIARQIGDTLLMARSLERMASVNLALGDDHLSLKLYYEALPLFQAVNNKKGIAAVYNIIGLYKSAQKEYDSAQAYYRKAMLLNEEAGNTIGVVHNKGILGY